MAKRTKKKAKRRRTTSEKVIIVLGIIIALSMILSLVVGLGTRGTSEGSSALPDDSWAPIAMELGVDGNVISDAAGTAAFPLPAPMIVVG